MTHESVLRRAPGVVARTIAGETILVPVRRRAQEMGLFTLNGVGTFVWQALDGTHSLQEIAGAVAAAFEVDPVRALADVAAFAADLERTGCATLRGEPAP
ncbi:MAG TPA: PqqD family protein [Myxococcota bacterium]|nr:PqqD family protein [Myxococcota bacterium]